MRRRWLWAGAGLLWVPLSAPVAQAAPAIYQQSLSVGVQWSGPGTYEADPSGPGATANYIVADSGDNDTFTALEIQGNLGPGASVVLTLYGQGAQQVGGGSVIGSMTLTAADVGHKVSLPGGVVGIGFSVEETQSESGYFWLEYTWSTDTDYTSTGTVQWVEPSWAPASGTDWSQVAQDFWEQWLDMAPPIPDPPPPPDIQPVQSPPPPPQPDVDMTPPDISAPQIDGVPTPPPETTPDHSNWTGGASDAIPYSVPPRGTDQWTIPDPTDLPHQDPENQPIPGDTPDPGLGTPQQLGGTSAPTTGSTPPPSASGPQPAGQGYEPSGTAPSPSGYSGASSPTWSWSAGSAPTVQPGGAGYSTPYYYGPPGGNSP